MITRGFDVAPSDPLITEPVGCSCHPTVELFRLGLESCLYPVTLYFISSAPPSAQVSGGAPRWSLLACCSLLDVVVDEVSRHWFYCGRSYVHGACIWLGFSAAWVIPVLVSPSILYCYRPIGCRWKALGPNERCHLLVA